jgi:hypothetical protein
MNDEPDDPAIRDSRLTNTLLWGIALGMLAGVALSIAAVCMMFAMGEQWNSINWGVFPVTCLMYYIGPCAGLGLAVAFCVNLITVLISRRDVDP